ncbi:MAG: pyridoxine 5'-phosphate synthase [Gammaproteobacteria bacterium AqS3]|nr:pyridoxine 5'-phosphate synthase [Gammaproteobacteria bacterium AqS3]
MTRLSVNLNKAALLRNARPEIPCDLTELAQDVFEAGAGGITVHPRPDGRHIRTPDVAQLGGWCAATPGVEFNIEGNPFARARPGYPGLLALAVEHRPEQCTLVPDADEQSTSDHGWDATADCSALAEMVAELKGLGARTSLFVDADAEGVRRLLEATRADCIELYTGPYALGHAAGDGQGHLAMHAEAAEAARALGAGVNAGHDLNLANLEDYVRAVRPDEVSIGHALSLDALRLGLGEAVRRYCARIIAALEHGPSPK